MREGIKNNSKGVAGFFLDGPILVLVIVIITVLIAMLSQAYIQYQRESERAELDRYCLDLKREIQRHPEMVVESENKEQRGEFSIEKLDELTDQNLTENLDVDPKYDFIVFINHTESEHEWTFGSSSDVEEASYKSSYRGPVLLSGEDSSTNLGELRVVVWED